MKSMLSKNGLVDFMACEMQRCQFNIVNVIIVDFC